MVDIKGSAIREVISAHQERDAAEYQRVLDRLDEPTRRLFLEPVQANAWFPLDAFVRYLEARVPESDPDASCLIQRAEFIIERQLRGIYRLLARLSSPESMVRRIWAVNTTYFRGVEVERRLAEESKAIVRYSGFERHHQIMEFIIIGFYRKALEICGAQNVEARFTTPIGDEKGYAELTLGWS